MRPSRPIFTLLSAALGLVAAPAAAQEAPAHEHQVDAAAPVPPSDAAAAPETVYVHGRREGPSRGAGDHDIKVGELQRVPRKDAAELLKMAPGIFLANPGGGTGHPYQVFLRGFDAREGQDIEFLVEGIPINEVGNVHGNGLADTHFILPELVQSLRVVEGPFAPQQGNFAVAGTAQYNLGLARRGYIAQTTVGSFGGRRAVLLWGPEGMGPHTFGGVEYATSKGFGDNRQNERMTAVGSYEGRIGKTGTFRLMGTSYATHYSTAGVLRVDDMKAGRVPFYGTYDPQQGGDSSRHGIAATFEDTVGTSRVTQALYATTRDFRLRSNLTGALLDPQLTTQQPHGQRGDLIDQRSKIFTLGARGNTRSRWTLGGYRQELELGYSGRLDTVDSVQQRNRSGTVIPYKTDLSLDSSLANLGMYADTSLKLLRWLTVRGGARVDLYTYRVTNRCAQTAQTSFGGDAPDTECFSSDRAGYRSPEQTTSTSASIVQPRGTALLGPFQGFTLSVSHGTGSRSIDPQYVAQGYDTPFARATSTEGGVSYAHSFESVEVTARSVFFQTSVDRDLFFNATEGRSTLASGTTRTGWAGNARATGDFFDLAGNVTVVRATFDDTHLLIPYVPSLVVRGDGALFGDLPFSVAKSPVRASAAVGFSYVGSRPLPFDERSEAIAVTDASVSISWKMATVALASTNLLDRKYRLAEYNYASDFRRAAPYPTLVAARHFVAGEPRIIQATLTLHLDANGS